MACAQTRPTSLTSSSSGACASILPSLPRRLALRRPCTVVALAPRSSNKFFTRVSPAWPHALASGQPEAYTFAFGSAPRSRSSLVIAMIARQRRMPKRHPPTFGRLFERFQQDAFVYVRAQIEEQFSASQLPMVHSKRQKTAGDSDLSQQSWFGRDELPDPGQVSQSDCPPHRQHCAVLHNSTPRRGGTVRRVYSGGCDAQRGMIEWSQAILIFLVDAFATAAPAATRPAPPRLLPRCHMQRRRCGHPGRRRESGCGPRSSSCMAVVSSPCAMGGTDLVLALGETVAFTQLISSRR